MLLTLPRELIVLLTSYLPWVDQAALLLSCRSFFRLYLSRQFWLDKCCFQFPYRQLPGIFPARSYRLLLEDKKENIEQSSRDLELLFDRIRWNMKLMKELTQGSQK